MDKYVFKLEADSKKDLPKHTKIINIHDVEYFLWIHIPEELSWDFELFQLDEIIFSGLVEVDFQGLIEREGRRPWFKLNSGLLNKEIGKHIYKMSMVNRKTNDVISLYFSYIIQDDNPDKPYIYMNRNESEVSL